MSDRHEGTGASHKVSETPVILYLDDEAMNLAVFEAAMPDEWVVHCFDEPLKAMKEMETIRPTVIVSDQRMPGMTGVEFLQLSQKICPKALRMIVTAYSDENLIVESVRKAKIFDYIRKPWNVDDLVRTLEKGHRFYIMEHEQEEMVSRLQAREKELREKNAGLHEMSEKLRQSVEREKQLTSELQSWVAPFLFHGLRKNKLEFPFRADLVGVAYDIINSGTIHELEVSGVPLRNQILQIFFETAMKYGGCLEGHAGDQAYVHFGLNDTNGDLAAVALATAREFRVALKALSDVYKVEVECGIALHFMKGTVVNMHSARSGMPGQTMVQKSFDTSSKEVDLLFRMEKLVHGLKGTNIIMTGEFLNLLDQEPEGLTSLGKHVFKNMDAPTTLHGLLSYYVDKQDILKFGNALNDKVLKKVG